MVWLDEDGNLKQPFLGQDDQQIDETREIREDCETRQIRSCTSLFSRNNYATILAHAIVLAIYSSIFVYVLGSRAKSCEHFGLLIYSPAIIFACEPTPQLDAAWHDLLANINIRISSAEMQRLNQTSLEL